MQRAAALAAQALFQRQAIQMHIRCDVVALADGAKKRHPRGKECKRVERPPRSDQCDLPSASTIMLCMSNASAMRALCECNASAMHMLYASFMRVLCICYLIKLTCDAAIALAVQLATRSAGVIERIVLSRSTPVIKTQSKRGHVKARAKPGQFWNVNFGARSKQRRTRVKMWSTPAA